MKIFLSPCVNDGDKVLYTFKGSIITATYKKIADIFDFTNLPDGELQLYDEKGNSTLGTTLEIIPIISARRENGVLYVELLNFIASEATESERFPSWVEV